MQMVDTDEWLAPYKGKMVEDFSEVTAEEKARIMHFLRSGVKLFMFKQRTSDAIFPNSDDGPSKNLRTDGEWVWGRDVGYYVRKYSIRPPEAFMKHMEAVEYKVGFVDDATIAAAVSFSTAQKSKKVKPKLS